MCGCGESDEATTESKEVQIESGTPEELSPREVFLAMNEATRGGDKLGVLAQIAPDTHDILAPFLESLTPESGAELAKRNKNLETHDGVEFGDVAVAIKSVYSDQHLERDLDTDPIFFRRIEGHWKMVPIDGPPIKRYFSALDLGDSFDDAAAWYMENQPVIRAKITERIKENAE